MQRAQLFVCGLVTQFMQLYFMFYWNAFLAIKILDGNTSLSVIKTYFGALKHDKALDIWDIIS